MAAVRNFALRLPPSLMEDVKALAAQDAVSVNQFVVQATAEKVAAMKARGYLADRLTARSQAISAVFSPRPARPDRSRMTRCLQAGWQHLPQIKLAHDTWP
jgi:hypothetical protein